jgi:hypothetical protein
MGDFKLLVDTNVVIGLEDPQPVQASLAELPRLCSENNVALTQVSGSFRLLGDDAGVVSLYERFY